MAAKKNARKNARNAPTIDRVYKARELVHEARMILLAAEQAADDDELLMDADAAMGALRHMRRMLTAAIVQMELTEM